MFRSQSGRGEPFLFRTTVSVEVPASQTSSADNTPSGAVRRCSGTFGPLRRWPGVARKRLQLRLEHFSAKKTLPFRDGFHVCAVFLKPENN